MSKIFPFPASRVIFSPDIETSPPVRDIPPSALMENVPLSQL